jgi:hypothetical protein
MRAEIVFLLLSAITHTSWSSLRFRQVRPFMLSLKGGGFDQQHKLKTNTRKLVDAQDHVFDIDAASFSEKISTLCYGLNMNFVDPGLVARKAILGICDGSSICDLYTLTAETAA